DPDLPYHAARAKVFLGQPDAAGPLIQEACRRQPVETVRTNYVRDYVQDMAEAGHGLAAYRTAPDRPQAFAALAGWLVSRNKAKELEDLLAEHRRDHADDAWLPCYAGELHLLRGAF